MSLAASVGASEFHPSLHRVYPDGRWLTGVKKRCRRAGVTCGDRVFLYKAIKTGRFVVAVRGDTRRGPPRFFVAVESMHGHPDGFCPDRPSAEWMVQRLRPARKQAAEGLRAMRDEECAARNAEAEQDSRIEEFARQCEKRGDASYARAVRQRRIPVAFPSSTPGASMLAPFEELALKMLTEGLARAARDGHKGQKKGSQILVPSRRLTLG